MCEKSVAQGGVIGIYSELPTINKIAEVMDREIYCKEFTVKSRSTALGLQKGLIKKCQRFPRITVFLLPFVFLLSS